MAHGRGAGPAHERGQGKGQGKGQIWVAGHDPTNFQIPNFLQRLGDQRADGSILLQDRRDGRVVSPFQGLSPLEIAENSNSSLNILTERQALMKPNSGYYLTMFSVMTLQVFKVTLVVSVDSSQGIPCAAWDGPTARALSHPAFQPFEWPEMMQTTPTLVDVKVKIGGNVLQHLVLTAYRSDNDLTVTRNWFNDDLVPTINERTDQISVTVAVFQGFRVSVITAEPGGRLYSAGPNGAVVAVDLARCHIELRKVVRNSQDAIGSDPDRVELRFLDAANRIEVMTARMSCPTSWLVGSHISGAAFSNIIRSIREQGGRVESPDHQLQLSQLAAIHDPWFNGSVYLDEEARERRAELRVVRTPSNAANVHLIWDSPLEFKAPDVVSTEALALGAHDRAVQAPAIFVPPMEGHGAQVVAALPGSNNPAIAAGLPPLPFNQAVYQPDQARGQVANFRPALVDEAAQDMPAAPVIELVDLDMETRRARAVPKARAPGIPQGVIDRALSDPTALSAGHRPFTGQQQAALGAPEAAVLIMAPPSALEQDLRAQIVRETDSRQALVNWLETATSSAAPGREAAHRAISHHDQRIGALVSQLDERRNARVAAARMADRPVPVGMPEVRGPLIEEVAQQVRDEE